MKSLANSIEGRFLLIVMYYFSSSIMNDAFNLASFVIYLLSPTLKMYLIKRRCTPRSSGTSWPSSWSRSSSCPLCRSLLLKPIICVCAHRILPVGSESKRKPMAIEHPLNGRGPKALRSDRCFPRIESAEYSFHPLHLT